MSRLRAIWRWACSTAAASRALEGRRPVQGENSSLREAATTTSPSRSATAAYP